MDHSKYYRINFSLPRNKLDIIDILNQMPNKSNYICQAIEEKYNNDKNGNNKDIDVKDIIKSTIDALISRSYLTSAPQTTTVTQVSNSQSIPTPIQVMSPALDNLPVSHENNDSDDLLKGMLLDIDSE